MSVRSSDPPPKVAPDVTTETDETPRKRYRRGSDLTRQTRIGARVAEPIAVALERRAIQTGRTKNEIVEAALARALGVEA